MKRARIILAGVGLLAVAGGIFASQTSQAGNRRATQYIYTQADPEEAICTVKLTGYTLSGTLNQPVFSTTYATTISGTCTTRPYYTGL